MTFPFEKGFVLPSGNDFGNGGNGRGNDDNKYFAKICEVIV